MGEGEPVEAIMVQWFRSWVEISAIPLYVCMTLSESLTSWSFRFPLSDMGVIDSTFPRESEESVNCTRAVFRIETCSEQGVNVSCDPLLCCPQYYSTIGICNLHWKTFDWILSPVQGSTKDFKCLQTDLEPDILECEVKWALESITTNKASGGDGIPVELFQILKDDAVKVLHSICQQIWKTQQWLQDWKRSVFIPIPKKRNAKECSNYHTIALISQASKVMLKVLQPGFNSTWNMNFQMFKLDLERAKEPKIK